jgi:hypothetical protein
MQEYLQISYIGPVQSRKFAAAKARIAAARSMTVAAPEPAINTNDPAEQAQKPGSLPLVLCVLV